MRHGYGEEGAPGSRAQVHRSGLLVAVEPLQPHEDEKGHHGEREDGVAGDDRPQTARNSECIQADDDRKAEHQGRQEEGHGDDPEIQRAQPALDARNLHRRERAEDGTDDDRPEGNLKAGPERVEEHGIVEHRGEPAGGEAHEGQAGFVGIVERQQDEQGRRRVEEDEIQHRIAEEERRAPPREAARILAGGLDPADHEPEHDHEQQDGDQEQHREGGAESPLKRVAELVRDQIRIKCAVGSADQLWRRVVAHHRDEGEDETRHDAGAGRRQGYRDQSPPWLRAEIGGGIQHRRVDPLDGDIGRQKGEREEQIDEGDHDRRPAEAEELDRLVDEAQAGQRLVYESLVPEHGEPGKDPDQIAGPEGNDRDQDPGQPARGLNLGRHEIGEGEAQQNGKGG